MKPDGLRKLKILLATQLVLIIALMLVLVWALLSKRAQAKEHTAESMEIMAYGAEFDYSILQKIESNETRACVKSVGMKFGNDQIFDMRNFDETSRWIGWSKNEFSHRLTNKATIMLERSIFLDLETIWETYGLSGISSDAACRETFTAVYPGVRQRVRIDDFGNWPLTIRTNVELFMKQADPVFLAPTREKGRS